MPSFEVEIPKESADRPASAKIAAWGIGGLLLGLLLAYGSLGSTPPEGSADGAPTELGAESAHEEGAEGEDNSDIGAEGEDNSGSAVEAEDNSGGAVEPEDEGEAEDEGEDEGEIEDEALAEGEIEPEGEGESGEEIAAESAAGGGDDRAAEASPAIPIEQLRVRRGRVAYLRCAGIERRGQRFPCPRDEALEGEVWPVIEALLSCADPPGAPGRADVRLDFQGDLAPTLDFRDRFSNTDVRVDPERTIACLREPMSSLRQHVGASRLTVSFRFEVVRR